MVNKEAVGLILGVVLSTVLLFTSVFLLVKVIRQDSFSFVRNQSILCIVYSGSSITGFLLKVSNTNKIDNTKIAFGYLLGYFTAYSIFLIYWNISLQYLVTSR